MASLGDSGLTKDNLTVAKPADPLISQPLSTVDFAKVYCQGIRNLAYEIVCIVDVHNVEKRSSSS